MVRLIVILKPEQSYIEISSPCTWSGGGSATVTGRKGDTDNDVRCGFEVLDPRDFDSIGVSGLLLKFYERLGGSTVYGKSSDIDIDDSR